MSKNYTTETASYITKRQSRKKVALDIKEKMRNGSIIHYLGGTSTQTPFENNFKSNDVTFVRYERLKSLIPSGYDKVEINEKEYKIPTGKKLFVNDDFFDSFFEIEKQIKGNETHLWLDFCGLPTQSLLECIHYTFLHKESDIDFKSLYITFFLNPRSCQEVKDLFQGEKTLQGKANRVVQTLEKINEKDDLSFEIFDTYNNLNSPMAVLKIERREKEKMSKKASLENYVALHKKGFTNKQIAVYWRAGIMQIAGFSACAKRKKMI